MMQSGGCLKMLTADQIAEQFSEEQILGAIEILRGQNENDQKRKTSIFS